jgi:hypothetical protein
MQMRWLGFCPREKLGDDAVIALSATLVGERPGEMVCPHPATGRWIQ